MRSRIVMLGFAGLLALCSVPMASAQQAGDGRELQTLLRQSAATVMQATPATWRMLIENGWEGKSDLRILCGGEALTQDLARQLLPRCRELWNMYGPTETTIWSSVDRVTSADRISLGLPIANTELYVFDENRKSVSTGEPGELWIGGTGLAHGYLNPFTGRAKTTRELLSRPMEPVASRKSCLRERP